MDGSGNSSNFDSASFSQEYGSEVKKMGGARKRRVTLRRQERGGQKFRLRAGKKIRTKRRGGIKRRYKK
uniref:Uncharacterized protein n=1 Tax=viral metagenome TaxID=1070528 RepID=A0A6C0K0Z3_9ZZZZ